MENQGTHNIQGKPLKKKNKKNSCLTINHFILLDAHPLSHIDEMISEVARYFLSILKLYSAYQITVKDRPMYSI